jgi:hypothetical protein
MFNAKPNNSKNLYHSVLYFTIKKSIYGERGRCFFVSCLDFSVKKIYLLSPTSKNRCKASRNSAAVSSTARVLAAAQAPVSEEALCFIVF